MDCEAYKQSAVADVAAFMRGKVHREHGAAASHPTISTHPEPADCMQYCTPILLCGASRAGEADLTQPAECAAEIVAVVLPAWIVLQRSPLHVLLLLLLPFLYVLMLHILRK